MKENEALVAAVRRERNDLLEQMVHSQKTMDEARELIKHLDLMLAQLQPNYLA